MPSLSRKLSPTVTDMIRFDHSHVLITFHQFAADRSPRVRKALADTICNALEIHAMLEEEIFYPAMTGLEADEVVLEKSEPEHDEMRRIIGLLRQTDPVLPRHAELVTELMRDVMHHVADEETVLLPRAERCLSAQQLRELGAAMTRRRMQLLSPQAGKIAVDTVVGFSGSALARVAGAIGAVCALGYVFSKSSRRST